jgi:hypothetical protein
MSDIVIYTNKPNEKGYYRRMCFCEDYRTHNERHGTVILTYNTTESLDEYSECKMRFKYEISDIETKTEEITIINTDTRINYVFKYKKKNTPFALRLNKWCDTDVPKYKTGSLRIIFGGDPFKTMGLLNSSDITVINFYKDENIYKPFKRLTILEQDYIKEIRNKQQSKKISQPDITMPSHKTSIMSPTQREYNKYTDMRDYMVDESSLHKSLMGPAW